MLVKIFIVLRPVLGMPQPVFINIKQDEDSILIFFNLIREAFILKKKCNIFYTRV